MSQLNGHAFSVVYMVCFINNGILELMERAVPDMGELGNA